MVVAVYPPSVEGFILDPRVWEEPRVFALRYIIPFRLEPPSNYSGVFCVPNSDSTTCGYVGQSLRSNLIQASLRVPQLDQVSFYKVRRKEVTTQRNNFQLPTRLDA